MVRHSGHSLDAVRLCFTEPAYSGRGGEGRCIAGPNQLQELPRILRLSGLSRSNALNRDFSIAWRDEGGKSAELRADHAQRDLLGPDGSRARGTCIAGLAGRISFRSRPASSVCQA